MRAPLLAALLLGSGCVDQGPCDAVRDLAASPAGLRLTEGEHPGWGQAHCAQCHHVGFFHQADCIDSAAINVAAIRAESDLSDPRTCVRCHGANGVEALQDTGDGGAP